MFNPDLKPLLMNHQQIMNFSVEKELMELLRKKMMDEEN